MAASCCLSLAASHRGDSGIHHRKLDNRDLAQQVVPSDSGVVDQDVDNETTRAAKFSLGGLNDAMNSIFRVAQVCLDCNDLDAMLLFELGGHASSRLGGGV